MKSIWFLFISVMIPVLGYAQNGNFTVKNHSDIYLTPIAVGLLSATLIAAHILAPETYSWKTNTISELASQNYNHAGLYVQDLLVSVH